MWYLIAFAAGGALGGAGIGWVMWNKMARIKETLAAVRAARK